MEEHDISYGELVVLEDLFDKQVRKHGVTFDCEEERSEQYFDFVDQYLHGNNNPQIRVL